MIPVSAEPNAHDHRIWLQRAERARAIAAFLWGKDAAIAEAYACDCEAEAQRLRERTERQPVAA